VHHRRLHDAYMPNPSLNKGPRPIGRFLVQGSTTPTRSACLLLFVVAVGRLAVGHGLQHAGAQLVGGQLQRARRTAGPSAAAPRGADRCHRAVSTRTARSERAQSRGSAGAEWQESGGTVRGAAGPRRCWAAAARSQVAGGALRQRQQQRRKCVASPSSVLWRFSVAGKLGRESCLPPARKLCPAALESWFDVPSLLQRHKGARGASDRS